MTLKSFALRSLQPTRRLLEFVQTPLSDRFLNSCLQYASAHVAVIKLEQKGEQRAINDSNYADALVSAKTERDEELRNVGLAYGDVLRFNLDAKFNGTSRPYDETGFFELLYRFINNAVHHKGVPASLRKEVDIALGKIFRGNDFNLEAKGFVQGRKPGTWMEQDQPTTGANGKLVSSKLRSVNTAIHCRSPAILSIYPDSKTVLQELDLKRRAKQQKIKRAQTARSRSFNIASTRQDTAIADDENHASDTNRQHERTILQCEKGPITVFDAGPLSASDLFSAPPKQRAKRPHTAGVVRNHPAMATCRERPQSGKTRNGSGRIGSATRRNKKPEQKQYVTSPNRPWSAHENWRPKLSWL